MPARISPEKESKIVKLYLEGASQTEIATSLNVSQSTVSEVISRFRKDASETSLDGASRSRGVLHEVNELRSLSADLRKAEVTVDEAKMGCKLIEELSRIGANLEMLDSLLAVYRRITPKDFPTDEFVQATARMVLLEKQYKMSYNDIVSAYEHTQPKLIQLNKDIETRTRELQEIIKKRSEAEADLQRRLEENRITLGRVQKVLEIRQNLDKAGLSLEKGEIVGNMLKVFCNLIESRGLSPEKAAADLERFLANARDIDEATSRIEQEAAKLEANRDSSAKEVQSLESEKKKLALENSFLKEAIDSVLELRKKYGIGIDEIAKIRSLAEKYGPPATILQALDMYKSLKDVQLHKASLDASVEELTRTEASLRGRIKTIEDELAALPAKTDESIKGVKSSLDKFSSQVQSLGDTIGKTSIRVDELKQAALAAGRDVAAVDSRVAAYKLTSRLIDFVAKGKGEEEDVIAVAVASLNALAKWVENQPKYSETKQQIESLKDKIEKQMILG
jgi:predicted transcriptional regulator